MRFVLEKEGVEFTAQTNSKSGFEEEEYETSQTDETGNRAEGIYDNNMSEHDGRQYHANYPGKLFLCRADIFWCLILDDPASKNQGRRKSWTNKNPYQEIGEKKVITNFTGTKFS